MTTILSSLVLEQQLAGRCGGNTCAEASPLLRLISLHLDGHRWSNVNDNTILLVARTLKLAVVLAFSYSLTLPIQSVSRSSWNSSKHTQNLTASHQLHCHFPGDQAIVFLLGYCNGVL